MSLRFRVYRGLGVKGLGRICFFFFFGGGLERVEGSVLPLRGEGEDEGVWLLEVVFGI